MRMLRYSGHRTVLIVSRERSERGVGLGGGMWGELQVYLLDASREQSWKDVLRIMEGAWRSLGGRVLEAG